MKMYCKRTCGICQLEKIRPSIGKKRIKEIRNKATPPPRFKLLPDSNLLAYTDNRTQRPRIKSDDSMEDPLYTQCNWADAQCHHKGRLLKVSNCRELCWCQVRVGNPDDLCKVWGESHRNNMIISVHK